MGSLAFFPWLKAIQPVSAGVHSLLLYSPGGPVPEGLLFDVDVRTVERILRQYKTRRQESVSSLNLLLRQGKPLGFDMTAIEREEAFGFARHLATAGLSARSFVGSPWEFASTGHFQLVVQPFTLPFTGSVSYRNRIKGGSTVVSTTVELHDSYLPEHLLQPVDPPIDVALLEALERSRNVNSRARQHLDASLSQFLLANSCSPDVPFDVETHATYAAIERVCDADQTLKSCVNRVQNLLSCGHAHEYAQALRDEMAVQSDQVDAAVREFLSALYVVRGALSHGHVVQHSKGWEELDLQVAGAFLFPLLLKCRLAELNVYRLTIRDAAEVAGLGIALCERPFSSRDAGADKTRWELSLERVDEALATVEIAQTLSKSLQLGE